jgi:lipopolysaccharide exporter
LIVISTAILNLALNYFFILKFGVLGAAYATLISNCIGFTIAQSILKKQLQVNILHTFIYAYRFYPEMFNRYVFKNKNQKANS